MGVGLQELLLHLRWDVHGFIFYRPCAAATATVSSQVPQSCRRCCFTAILPKRKLLCLSGAFLWSAPAGAKSHSLPSSPSVARSVGCSGIALHRLSTSYLSPRKCGRGVFLSQHLFAFPMQIPSSGFSIPLNLWAQLFSLMDMEARDGSPLQPLTAWRLPAKCIFDLWLRLPFPCSCFLFSTISYLFLVTTCCAMLTWRINNYLDGPQ